MVHRLFIPGLLIATVLIACGESAAEPPPDASEAAGAATDTPEPSATPTPPPTPAVRFDPAVPPGVLLIDYGPRDGWDSGGPGSARGALVGLDAATGAELDWWQLANTGHASSGFVSPDGRLVLFSGSYDFVLDTATGGVRRLEGPPWDLWPLAWAADSQTVHGVELRGGRPSRPSRLWSVDAKTGASRLVAEFDFQVTALRLSPAGNGAYTLSHRSEQCCGIEIEGDPFIAVIDLVTGTVRAEIPLPGVVVGQKFEDRGAPGSQINILRTPGIAIAPDGSRLYVAHADEDRITTVDLAELKVLGTDTPRPRKSVMGRFGSWLSGLFASDAKAKGGAYFVKETAVSPDGRWLYVTGSGAEICETDEFLPCVDGAPMGLQIIDTASMEIAAQFDGIGHMIMTPDGSRVVGWGRAYDYASAGESAREVSYGPYVIETAAKELIGQVEPPIGGWELAVSRAGRYAYVVARGPGYEEAMRTGSWSCDEPCSLLTVIDLDSATIEAQRPYRGATIGLVGLVPRP